MPAVEELAAAWGSAPGLALAKPHTSRALDLTGSTAPGPCNRAGQSVASEGNAERHRSAPKHWGLFTSTRSQLQGSVVRLTALLRSLSRTELLRPAICSARLVPMALVAGCIVEPSAPTNKSVISGHWQCASSDCVYALP